MQYKRAIKKMKGYQDSLYYSRDVLAFLINCVQLTYERQNFTFFKELMNELSFFADKLKNVEAHLVWKVFNFLSTDEVYDNKKRYELFFVLEFLNKDNYINYINSVVNDFK